MPVILLILVWLSTSVWATALVNRYQYISSDVLPDGVWTFGVSHGQSMGSGAASFGSQGAKVSNQTYFSRDLTYGHLLDEINDPLEKELAGAAFDAYGKNLTDGAGYVRNTVEVGQKSNAYVLGRGYGKRQSFFLIFPVVTITTRFRSTFEPSSSLAGLAKELQAEGQFKKAQEILEKSQNALEERLDENGYRAQYPTELTTLANIWVAHRYKAIEGTRFSLTTDSNIIIPAGHKTDEDDFLYLRINEEQYSFRQGLIGSYFANKNFSILASTYYHKRFAFNKKRRIPQNGISPLSNDIENTRTQYGDAYGTSLQMNASFWDGYTLYGGQSFEIKNRDDVSGDRFESRRYDYLAYRTSQNLSITYVGLSLNTIQSFLRQKFPIPVEMNLQYAKSQAGKNTFNNEVVALNMMVFYK